MTLVHSLINNDNINSNIEIQANDQNQAVSRNVVLRSIKNELQNSENEIENISQSITEDILSSDKKIQYITVVLQNLYKLAHELACQLVEFYIAVGRASEAALIGKRWFES